MTPQRKHRQVDLPELGFTVDDGLEEFIRGCWRRGIATFVSCIGGDGEPGYIGFTDPASAMRFEEVVAPVDWIGEDEDVMTVAEFYFTAEDVAELVAILSAL